MKINKIISILLPIVFGVVSTLFVLMPDLGKQTKVTAHVLADPKAFALFDSIDFRHFLISLIFVVLYLVFTGIAFTKTAQIQKQNIVED